MRAHTAAAHTAALSCSTVRAPRGGCAAAFAKPLFLSELLLPHHRPLLEDGAARITLAYELVETHVCAAADAFAGNMLTPYAHAVCYERNGGLASESEPAVPAVGEAAGGAARKLCKDLYSRDPASLKASKTGKSWF